MLYMQKFEMNSPAAAYSKKFSKFVSAERQSFNEKETKEEKRSGHIKENDY